MERIFTGKSSSLCIFVDENSLIFKMLYCRLLNISFFMFVFELSFRHVQHRYFGRGSSWKSIFVSVVNNCEPCRYIIYTDSNDLGPVFLTTSKMLRHGAMKVITLILIEERKYAAEECHILDLLLVNF